MSFGNLPGSWPRDLKLFALLSAVWASGLTARLVSSRLGHYSDGIEAVIGGIKFFGTTGAAVLIVQAAIFLVFAIGIAMEKRWGLMLALLYMIQVVLSHLVFIIAYLDNLDQRLNVRIAGFDGIGAVLILLYLWMRSRDVLLEDPS